MAQPRIAMLGAGSWGTALSISLARSGHTVQLWGRRPELVACLKQHRRNKTYLPHAELPDTVHVTDQLAEAVADASFWVFATPSQAIRSVATQIADQAGATHRIVSVAKGIENKTLYTTTEVLAETLSHVPAENMGVLYGPSHAEEVAAELPTTVVASAHSESIAEEIQQVFMTRRLRVYVNTDLRGVEIAGSVKNVIAIATGISDGVGNGDNTKAALITRGLAEIKRLGTAMGADPATFSGLAGLGDLIVTCMSRHSRNRSLGEQVGRGRSREEVEAEMNMVAEGVSTTLSVRALAQRHGVEMPITSAVYRILFEHQAPAAAVEDLMTRAARHEETWMGGHPT